MQTVRQVIIGDGPVTIEQLVAVARGRAEVKLSPQGAEKIARCRRLVERFVAEGRIVYGVTTGLGELCKVRLSAEEASLLSRRVLMSHACGVGEPLPEDFVRAIMFAAVTNFSQGHSGVRLEVVQTLIRMLNEGIVPWVPSQGSVGYLTHMAHISLVLIGMGQAYYQGALMSGAEAMARAGISLLELKEKEGLSLVNGTVCMTGIGALVVHDAKQLAKWADIAGAMSVEALKGTRYAFDERVHNLRPFPGQRRVAANLLALLRDSEIAETYKDYRLQDALSLRSIPQIHGACRDKISHAEEMVTIELNAATDNPLLFEDGSGGIAISACNAHGEPVALTMDMLAMAISELANVSERRLDRLVNPHVSELPPFLVEKSGLNSGFMIPQYVAASLVAENKVLCHPISVDSIPTSAFQEDHVSMGTPAALKALQVLKNAQKVIAIELLAAAQALEFHKPLGFGRGTGKIYELLRTHIPYWQEDRLFYPDLHLAIRFVESGEWIREVEAQVGTL
ncbi:histidine ammonia-lyase [Brevibacillus marinus]|uniref:histidine ammonia-lyase n=1 Tax=Brevibacillus marinus TaxID=2496837 RepID=UPI0019D07F21|nr:histidine ammonia-lyase [Brevibacillus marinus]